ncbi:kinesin motor domain protein [Teladorsagia circumcincta]|uniref:Kinesin motor domain protein n=1 Tax=Teladorsagia circumcincta TaxID=45464 RepID=A0A2G9V4K5_TELCI|nr:kinesin motor domain protein [Teladorsagia circumcincta]
MGAIQMALEAEKGKSAMMQVAIDAKDSEIANLKNELNERMEDIGRLTSELAAKRDELREKDEAMRHLHNAVVDLKGKGSLNFEFQRVFGPNMSQARVFNDVEELILSCLHGYNVSIIAYGEGESEGIIPRAVKFLFQSRNKLADLDWKFEFKASFIEVYNEEVYDLLGERKKLDVKMGSGTTCVVGLKYHEINAIDDIENILAVTDRTRSTAATKCNEQSSRSHAVFELTIQGHNKTSGASRHACLHLVDLAGSERVKESGAEGERFKEMTHINSALSNLQNCIRCQLNKNPHIPYRNSKLTMILRDSLGAGNSKTMVIVALNPAVTQIAETKRSLEFAQQMSMTKIGSAKKQEQ